MNEDKMKFMAFTWMKNPEEFTIRSVCEPEYEINSSGGYDYTGIGPLCRIFTGRGVFVGADAHEMYNALQVLQAVRQVGELYHPTWGTTQAYLTELRMEQESRPQYIAYSFTFREADEEGMIPWLPETNSSI